MSRPAVLFLVHVVCPRLCGCPVMSSSRVLLSCCVGHGMWMSCMSSLVVSSCACGVSRLRGVDDAAWDRSAPEHVQQATCLTLFCCLQVHYTRCSALHSFMGILVVFAIFIIFGYFWLFLFKFCCAVEAVAIWMCVAISAGK